MSMSQAERDAEDAKWEAERPQREWEGKISASDALLPRWGEDIIDALDAPSRARIAAETLAKYNSKKEIRSRKP